MAKIEWDNTGERYYETGVKHGVLYTTPNEDKNGGYTGGVAWNGLTSVSENPSGAEPTALYADDIKYLNLMSAEDFSATIEAYTYPDEFGECDGTAEIADGITIGQQSRKTFGFCYTTSVGDDLVGTEKGYKIHLIYNALASPSEKAYQTINDSPDAVSFSWSISTTPVSVTGYKPTAHLIIDSTKVTAEVLAKIEDVLYGSSTTEAKLLTPDEIAELIAA